MKILKYSGNQVIIFLVVNFPNINAAYRNFSFSWFVKLTNDSNEDKSLSLKAGQGMVQGIFFEFGIVEDDDVTEERNGGFGSTTK